MMRSTLVIVAAIAVTLALALPAGAGAATIWRCQVPGQTEPVDFVTAGDAAAKNGLPTANDHAGATFSRNFGEVCIVVHG
jgi:hypothetical protein